MSALIQVCNKTFGYLNHNNNNAESTNKNINDILPSELIHKTLSYLEGRDEHSALSVCKQWNNSIITSAQKQLQLLDSFANFLLTNINENLYNKQINTILENINHHKELSKSSNVKKINDFYRNIEKLTLNLLSELSEDNLHKLELKLGCQAKFYEELFYLARILKKLNSTAFDFEVLAETCENFEQFLREEKIYDAQEVDIAKQQMIKKWVDDNSFYESKSYQALNSLLDKEYYEQALLLVTYLTAHSEKLGIFKVALELAKKGNTKLLHLAIQAHGITNQPEFFCNLSQQLLSQGYIDEAFKLASLMPEPQKKITLNFQEHVSKSLKQPVSFQEKMELGRSLAELYQSQFHFENTKKSAGTNPH